MKQNRVSEFALSVLSVVEHVGLAVVTLATISAMVGEVDLMWTAGKATLADLLLMFLYLEILAMVGLYYKSGKLPVRFPIYIAIVALARFLVLDLKNLDVWQIIGVTGGVLLLTLAVLTIRYGHVKYRYGDDE
ncbi:MAG: phosphate-starvation-inducible PsiE family protein [Betaproteobacteria bacterium]|nr:phosphate-starvation-inducible PsiE family protein [Betaproteobacteria bacterium]